MDNNNIVKNNSYLKYYIFVFFSGLIPGLLIQLRWLYFHGGISLSGILESGWGKEMIILRLTLSPLISAALFLFLYRLASIWLAKKKDIEGIKMLGNLFLFFFMLILWRIFVYKYWYLYMFLAVWIVLVLFCLPYMRNQIVVFFKYIFDKLKIIYTNELFNRTLIKLNKYDFLTVFIIALVAIWWLFKHHFGYVVLDAGKISWLMGYDWAQHFLGWHFFRNEPWGFPLGKISDFFYPVGTTIGFTDSIPLMALTFKLFNAWLPPVFQYIGWWFLVCFVLQAFFATLLLREFKISLPAKIAGVLFFVFSPVLLGRYPHPALCSQWLITGSLWLWFYARRRKNKALIFQIILLFISTLVHPYLCVIVTVFTIALAWKVTGGINFKNIAAFAFVSALGLLIVFGSWYAVGYIGVSSGYELDASGFGWFSANFNTFFNSADTSIYVNRLHSYTKGQAWEGYAYLGLGMILLSGIILFTAVASLFDKNISAPVLVKTLKNNILLIIIVVAFALFAVSNIGTIGGKVIYNIPLDENFLKNLSPFRSSGRFIWPAYYLIFLSVIIFFGRGKFVSEKLSYIILIICLLIQFADIRFLTRPFYLTDAVYEETTSIDFNKWKELYESNDNIIFYPPFGRNYKGEDDYIQFAYLAGNMHKKINIGYLARIDKEKTESEKYKLEKLLDSATIPPGTLFVTTPDRIDRFYPLIESKKMGFAILDGYYVGVSPDNRCFANEWMPLAESPESFVKRNSDKTIFFAVKDEAISNMPPSFKIYMDSIGSKVNNLKYRGSWAGIIHKGKLLFEQISNTGPVEIIINKGDLLGGVAFEKKIILNSAGNEFGNKATIMFDDVDFSLKTRGVNFVVADDNSEVTEVLNVDTFYGPKGFHFTFLK